MEDTLTVRELIEQLQKVDESLPVYVVGLGITEDDSWTAPLEFDYDTVDDINGKCVIRISAI